MESATADKTIRLSTPVRELPGVGPRRAEYFSRLGVRTAGDLLRHLPMRYEHESSEGTIHDLPMDGIGSTRGTIVATRWIPPISGKARFEATLEDHVGRLSLTWFNAGYLRKSLHVGMQVRVHGKVKAFGGYPQMVNPKWEPLDDYEGTAAKEERFRPVYPAAEELPSGQIEKVVAEALPQLVTQVVDPLPEALVKAHAMPSLPDAFRMAHAPANQGEADAARRRLAFNELLLLQLGIAIKRHLNRTLLQAPALKWSSAIDQHIRERFPFKLTEAQEVVIQEIAGDLQHGEPMNRLLQGDVGAGKTVVALYALLVAVANRKQGAIMAPTELLAEQHYASISSMLEGSTVKIALLTGSQTGAERQAMVGRIESGQIDIVIGTQALLTESVRFADLAVVVVDEQHRFGVLQRAAFRKASGGTTESERQSSPHYLVMTATPIPRTLSLTVFGDLDISTIRGLPPGRQPIVTRVVDASKSDDVYRYLAKRVAEGEQAYVVVPAIDAAGKESEVQLKSVHEHAKLLQDKYLKAFKVAAVHGRLKPETRETVMHRFRTGRIHALVATTVIEVGVDVPNATMMVVEHAERFGLAQLHQLRGRIGRGTHKNKSVCVFIAEPTTEDAQQRMKAIGSTTDGFKIAEDDLSIRGMGELFGTKQSGLPPLRVAQIPGDMDLLQLAKRDAEAIVASDPDLTDPSRQLLRKVLIQTHGEALGLVDVG